MNFDTGLKYYIDTYAKFMQQKCCNSQFTQTIPQAYVEVGLAVEDREGHEKQHSRRQQETFAQQRTAAGGRGTCCDSDYHVHSPILLEFIDSICCIYKLKYKHNCVCTVSLTPSW